MRLLLENLPASLGEQRDCLASCLEAMNSVMPLRAVYFFGSHARGEARDDSDVDLCIVADGVTEQLKTAQSVPASSTLDPPQTRFHSDSYCRSSAGGKDGKWRFLLRHRIARRGLACRGKLMRIIRRIGSGWPMPIWR